MSSRRLTGRAKTAMGAHFLRPSIVPQVYTLAGLILRLPIVSGPVSDPTNVEYMLTCTQVSAWYDSDHILYNHPIDIQERVA